MREATLIEAALHVGLFDSEFVESVRRRGGHGRQGIIDRLLAGSRLPRNALYRAVAEQRNLPFVEMTTMRPQMDLVSTLTPALITRRQVLPVFDENDADVLVMSDPDDRKSAEHVDRISGRSFRLGISDPEELRQAIQRALAATAGSNPVASSSNAVSLLNRILSEAYLARATDVHFESTRTGMRVRFRIDGRLRIHQANLAHASGNAVLSRIKVLANLDITEQRSPQDGRFSHRPMHDHDCPEVDLRVATAPTRWGERASLRLLESDAGPASLTQLGMNAVTLDRFRSVARRPSGLVLITGPTGSGKSTTLYAALRELDRDALNVMTVEDPIESVVEGISQIPVSARGRLGFADALRSVLRHDPDVLMIGEIRDHETADIAIKAAMTGHLVFSTLHTETAPAAVDRLLDLGRDAHLVGSILRGVIGQRLVRRICERCRRTRPASVEEAELVHTDAGTHVSEAVGCARCLGTGYFGRIGLFEALWIDEQFSADICGGKVNVTRADGDTVYAPLADDARAKVLDGVTSLSEVKHFLF